MGFYYVAMGRLIPLQYEGIMTLINLFACLFLFAFASWAILSPRFSDGLLMKQGLCLLAITSLASLLRYYDTNYKPDPETVLANIGFFLITFGMLKRRFAREVWHKWDRRRWN